MFQRFFDEGLAQSSFLIACPRTREAAVVDPRRDVDVYVAAARERDLTLVYAIDTHIHADFLSGSRELGSVGARAVSGPGGNLQFPHHEARDGDVIALGDIALTVLHTPGHTPEHITLLVEEPGAPRRLLTGDTLFVGAVGRPDLLGEELTRRLAGQLFDSLQRLLALDDDVEVHPGHGAGSLCGAGIGTAPSSTIGRERLVNALLRHRSKEPFIAEVLGDLPETPPYFSRMKRVNQAGPPLMGLWREVAAPAAVEPAEAYAALNAGGVAIDLRGPDAFAAAHPTGALHLASGSKVGYWAGWVVPPDTPIVLLAENEQQAREARRQLLRVGLDAVAGWIRGGFEAWHEAGLPVSSTGRTTVTDLIGKVSRHAAGTLVDVRSRREFESGHLEGAVHIPVGEIAARAGDLPKDRPVTTICEGGFRSSLAASLLAREGFPSVSSVAGGMAEYRTRAAV